MIVSIKTFPHSPRTVTKQVRPNKVYVSPGEGMLAGAYDEFVWLKQKAGVELL